MKHIGACDLFPGKDVEFQDEGSGTITEVTDDAIYIMSKFW